MREKYESLSAAVLRELAKAFGPLLVSLFLLFVDMFRKEFLLEDNQSAMLD